MVVSDDARLMRKVYTNVKTGEPQEITIEIRAVKSQLQADAVAGTKEHSALIAARRMLIETMLLTPKELNLN